MTRTWLVATLLAASGCASTRATPPGNAASNAEPLAVIPRLSALPRVTIVATFPDEGSKLEANTRLRVVGEYALEDFAPGRDRITVVFKARGKRTWESKEYVLSQAKGQVVFEIGADELSRESSLVRPLQVLLVLDRQASPGTSRALRSSDVIHFDLELATENNARLHLDTKFPPEVGKGTLLSDVVHDRRYKPFLPPALNIAGHSYAGLYKVCIDDDGGVYSVKMLKSAHVLVDAVWMKLIRTYEHRPYTVNGVDVPYCYPLRLEVRSTD
jgi:hypothetical protein